MAQDTIYAPGTEQDPNGFPTNTVNKLFIDTEPQVNDQGDVDLNDLTTGKWAWVAAGISSVTPSTNETTTNDQYYDGDGYGDSDVTAKRLTLALSGNRKIGDPAQEFIASKTLAIGNSVKTRAIWIENGQVVVSSVTLTNIVPTGGNANSKQTFSTTISFNGRPRTVKGQLTMTISTTPKVYTASVDTSKTDAKPQGVVVDDATEAATNADHSSSTSSVTPSGSGAGSH